MKQRVLSAALALCLLFSSQSMASAQQEVPSPQGEISLFHEGVPLPVEGSLPQKEVPLPIDGSLPQEGDSLSAEGSLPQEDGSLPVEDSLPQEGDSLPAEGSLPQEDGSLPVEDSLPQEGDSLSAEGSLPQKDSSLPAEDSMPQEKDTLSQESISSSLGEDFLPQEEASSEGFLSLQAADGTVPTPAEVYAAMIALKDQDEYKEGTIWTNDEPYSGSGYSWNGGLINGVHISAVGCVAFAFILSDAAFGNLPNRMYAAGEFDYDDIKAGDILRVNNDVHTVIVLEANDVGVVVAEGNISTGDHKGKVHWGRAISKEEVMLTASHYITRYPEGYVPPDDPSANVSIASGTLEGGLTWNLTKAGTLTISGSGAMPDFSAAEEQPWHANSSQLRTVVIEEGVTGIGACAFWKCGILSVEIPPSVTAIGNYAFRESSIISVNIPSGVKTIGNDAFNNCANLSSVTVSEGVETIGERAFQSCASLTAIALPASISEVGAAAFWQCGKLAEATFAPGSRQVKLGDNLFSQCYYLRKVTLPQSIDRIGNGMFQNCLTLAGVEIPQGAESIGEHAFASSGVSVVLIPDSVTSIGTAAFSACPLTDIYFTGTEAQWNSIRKLGDTATAVSKATIHYEYSPEPTTTPEPTATPEPTQTPAPTATPEPTATPMPTQAPEQTTTPAPAATPNPTARPQPTQAPGQTAAPESTAAPMPRPTPAPNSGTVPKQTATFTPALPQASTTPAPALPSIVGKSGKQGWAAIRDEAADASDGKRININMNGVSVVPGNILDIVKGQDVTLSFDMGDGIVWSVNGQSMTADHADDVDFSVQIGEPAIPQDIVDYVAGDCQSIPLSLAHNGDFGCSAVLMIHVDSTHAGLYANLFYYDESAGELEYVTAGQIKEDGLVELVFTHASDYIIVVSDDVMDGEDGILSESRDEATSADEKDPQETEASSRKTDEADAGNDESGDSELQAEGNHLNFMWLLFIGAAGLAVAGALAFLIHRKANKEGLH